MKGVEAAEVLTTAKCPLNCRYCYIPKTAAMGELHQNVISALEKGIFLDNLEKISGKNLKSLSFWGTEPSLTLDILKEKLNEIRQRFPYLKEIKFSTSMVMPEPILRFAEALEKVDPNIRFEVQVSIDGPDFITDKNRFAGAAEKIPENFFRLVSGMQNLKNKVDFRWKSTLCLENIIGLNEEPDKIDSYFNFFLFLEDKFKEINKNPNISLTAGSYLPTLAVPGRYTSEDGKIFADFLKKIHTKGFKSTYSGRLLRLFQSHEELGNKRRMFSCSGGDSNMGVENRLHICHRSFYLDEDQYINSIFRKAEMENWDISLFQKGNIDFLKKYYMPFPDNEYEKSRFQYILRGYHDFWPLILNTTKAMINELALAGQAEKAFLQNEEYATLFALFINTCLSCPMENILNTGCIHLPPLSLIKVFGNGAFREVLRSI